MARLIADLEPLYGLYDKNHGKELVKHAIALEAAGAEGVIISLLESKADKIKTIRNLLENLEISVSVRAKSDEKVISDLCELKPSMAIYTEKDADDSMLSSYITRLQVDNILAAIEIPLTIDGVKKAAKLKCDYVFLDCAALAGAESINDKIEILNNISKLAALAYKLSLGVAISGDLKLPDLKNILTNDYVEEYVSGIPLYTRSLLNGYLFSLREFSGK